MGPSTTSTNMLANSSVHSSHGVRSMNTKPSRRSRSHVRLLVIRFADRRSRAGLRRDQQHQADGEEHRHHDGAQCRERRTDQDARDGGSDGALKHRAHDTFDAVGGQQLFGGQDPRQDGAVGGEEERRSNAQRGRGHRHDARSAARQPVPAPRSPTTAITLTVSTAMMIERWLMRSAAIPPTRRKATRPTPRQVATSDSDTGSLSSSMT